MTTNPAAAVLARRSERFISGFGRYARWYVARNFHGVRIARDGIPQLPEGRPAIIYSNHPSWWDPLIFMVLQQQLFPNRIGFGPMNAVTLRQYPFMGRLGVFGVTLNSHEGAVEFLQTSLGLLAVPNSVLWVTAEGHFTDPRQRPIQFPLGLAHLVRRAPEATVLPLALEYPFWDQRYPEALIRFGRPVLFEGAGGQPSSINDRLEAALGKTMDALAALSMARKDAAFEPLMRGNAGVGGFYDLWRRMKAWSRGRSFTPQHTDGPR